MIPVRPKFTALLRRALYRKCPRCGEGSVMRKWYSAREDCEVCGLQFVRNPGDLWAFWVIGDRLVVGAAKHPELTRSLGGIRVCDK